MCDPKINTAYTFDVALEPRGAADQILLNPTLAAGDVQVKVDDGSFANLATLPTVTPAASGNVKVSLSAAEMNGTRIAVRFRDVAGAEWKDLFWATRTSAVAQDDIATATALAAVAAQVTAVQADTDDIQTRLPATLDASGRMKAVAQAVEDKTGYTITATEHNNIADALLKRDWTAIAGEAAYSVLNALRGFRNKVTRTNTVITVYKENGSTVAFTQTVVASATAQPITDITPN